MVNQGKNDITSITTNHINDCEIHCVHQVCWLYQNLFRLISYISFSR